MNLNYRPMRKARGLLIAAMTVSGMVSGHAADEADASRAPLMIQRQGSFTVGGTVVRSPGTYDPERPGPAGQTLHGSSIRCPSAHASCRS